MLVRAHFRLLSQIAVAKSGARHVHSSLLLVVLAVWLENFALFVACDRCEFQSTVQESTVLNPTF